MGKKILLIDDDDVTNFYNKTIVSELPEVDSDNVKVAVNGQDALDLLNGVEAYDGQGRFFPDVIFLDINMPVMGGFEFLEHYNLLDEEQKQGTIVVMLTTSMHHLDKAKADDMQDLVSYINKPLEKEMVLKVLNKL